MKVVPNRDRVAETGTLLWIGETSVSEFHSAYQHCVRHADQIALRDNALEAIRRPAADVRRIVVARTNRIPSDRDAFTSLSQQYPEARWIDLLGTFCEGIRQSSIGDSTRVAWHRWDQVLPDWIQESSGADPFGSDMDPEAVVAASSVAVVASNFNLAQAYLDLAEGHGVTAVWCQSPDSMRVRNIEAVWWDDSAAQPVSADAWRDRVAKFNSANQPIRHAWITQTAWLDQQQAAIEGGIETIISKPYHIDSLLRTIGRNQISKSMSRQAA